MLTRIWDTEEAFSSSWNYGSFFIARATYFEIAENNLLANRYILAVRPGFISGKKTQIIGQPVTLGLAGFHYSVLHCGT